MLQGGDAAEREGRQGAGQEWEHIEEAAGPSASELARRVWAVAEEYAVAFEGAYFSGQCYAGGACAGACVDE